MRSLVQKINCTAQGLCKESVRGSRYSMGSFAMWRLSKEASVEETWTRWEPVDRSCDAGVA